MSHVSRELVYPASASILQGRDIYRLESNNLLINFTLHTAYVIPDLLSIPDLRDALSRTLVRFPLFCGILVKDPEWAIDLSGSRPIALSVWHEHGSNQLDSPERAVVVVPRPGPLIDKVDPFKLLSNDESELLKVTIVITENTTVLGVSCSHMLADHAMVLKFFRTWSQHFTEEVASPVETSPVYDLPLQLNIPSDTASIKYMRSKLPPILFHTFPLNDIPYSIFSPFSITRIDVRLAGHQVVVLHDHFLSWLRDSFPGEKTALDGSEEVIKLSRQDILSAFIITAMSMNEQSITRVSTVVNCRGFNRAIVPEDAAGNALIYAVTDSIGPVALDRESLSQTVLAYARAIRLSLQTAHDPQYVHDFLALAGQEWLAAARANRGHYIAETPGHVMVNSYYRMNWASAHFGFPGKVCWQHPDNIMTDNYIMMFPSNPTRGADAVWRTDNGACEMTFNVKKGLEGQLEAAVALLWEVVVGDADGPVVTASEVVL